MFCEGCDNLGHGVGDVEDEEAGMAYQHDLMMSNKHIDKKVRAKGLEIVQKLGEQEELIQKLEGMVLGLEGLMFPHRFRLDEKKNKECPENAEVEEAAEEEEEVVEDHGPWTFVEEEVENEEVVEDHGPETFVEEEVENEEVVEDLCPEPFVEEEVEREEVVEDPGTSISTDQPPAVAAKNFMDEPNLTGREAYLQAYEMQLRKLEKRKLERKLARRAERAERARLSNAQAPTSEGEGKATLP